MFNSSLPLPGSCPDPGEVNRKEDIDDEIEPEIAKEADGET